MRIGRSFSAIDVFVFGIPQACTDPTVKELSVVGRAALQPWTCYVEARGGASSAAHLKEPGIRRQIIF